MDYTRLNRNGHFCRIVAIAGVALGAGGIRVAHAEPVLRCHVTYAGSTQTIEARPVADPYTVAKVDIGGRFWFKPVVTGRTGAIESIKLYAYIDTQRQPVLIHIARYLPPFKTSPAPYLLTGDQTLFAGPVERELGYHCTLEGVL